MPAGPDGPSLRLRIECGCGFAVEGREEEVVGAARRHATDVHGVALADGIVQALARPVAPAASPDHPEDEEFPT